MNEMEITKIVGASCGALLVFMLMGWASETIYHVGGGHGGEDQMAYVIETGDDEGGASDEAAEEVDFAALMASADAGKGERVWGKCQACHKLEVGANGTGPHLAGVVNRDIASVGGFAYSDALLGLDGAWTPEHLEQFLANPKGYAPGTKMGFAGLPKVEDRANLIAYLETIGG